MTTSTFDLVTKVLHPRRFSIRRDMSNGRYDVWDAYKDEYVACDVRRTTAERIVYEARIEAFKASWRL